MEGSQGGGSTQGLGLVASHLVQELHDGVSVPLAEDGGDPGVDRTGMALQTGGGADVALPSLGYNGPEGYPASHAGAAIACNNPSVGADTPRAHIGPDAAPISCNTTTGSHIHGALGMLHVRGQSAWGARTNDVSGAVMLGPVRGNEAHGGQSGSRAKQSQSAGDADPQNAGAVIAGLQLINQGNHCYQHAMLLSYVWAATYAAGCTSLLSDSDASRAFHGRLHPVIVFLMHGVTRVLLCRCLMWQSLLQQWRHRDVTLRDNMISQNSCNS